MREEGTVKRYLAQGAAWKDWMRSFKFASNSERLQMSSQTPQITGKARISATSKRATCTV